MKKNLIVVDWKAVEKYSQEEMSYFLFLEGKPLEAICKIRNLDKATVQRHIIEGKIKYRFLAKSSNIKELFESICNAGKEDKMLFLKYLKGDTKDKLVLFMKENYADMPPKQKEKAVWILGELKDGVDILKKASVHKFVNIRRMAISAMGKVDSEECEVPLIRALDDENPQVVLYAIKALNKLKSKKALEKLCHIKESTDKEYLKRAIEEYVKE